MISGLVTVIFSVFGFICWFIAFLTVALSGLNQGSSKKDKWIVWNALSVGATFFYFAYKAWTEL